MLAILWSAAKSRRSQALAMAAARKIKKSGGARGAAGCNSKKGNVIEAMRWRISSLDYFHPRTTCFCRVVRPKPAFPLLLRAPSCCLLLHCPGIVYSTQVGTRRSSSISGSVCMGCVPACVCAVSFIIYIVRFWPFLFEYCAATAAALPEYIQPLAPCPFHFVLCSMQFHAKHPLCLLLCERPSRASSSSSPSCHAYLPCFPPKCLPILHTP
ncbi:hypothetical protein BX070DRAFT_88857 [Coemansia spiralis]|nr:hypothetical protein BX070DRAFT_88857 [Coemansia spiralis]